jgi:hypothetical protein
MSLDKLLIKSFLPNSLNFKVLFCKFIFLKLYFTLFGLFEYLHLFFNIQMKIYKIL